MQIKITFYLLILGLLTSNLHAQELGQAVIVTSPKYMETELSNYHHAVVKHLNDNTGDHFILYQKQQDATTFNNKVLFDKKEVPVSIIHLMEPYFRINKKPDAVIINDLSGKAVKMVFQLNHLLAYKIKSIQVATGEVVVLKLIVISRNDSQIEIKDFAKYFGGNPNELIKDAKKYKAATAKAHEAFKNEINKSVAPLLKKLDFSHPIKNSEFAKAQDELYTTEQGQTEEEDPDPRLLIQSGSNQNISSGDLFYIYSKETPAENYEYFILETRGNAREVQEETAAIGPVVFGKKGFRKMMEKNIPLFATRNEDFAKNYTSKKLTQKVSIALEFNCTECNSDVIESYLASKPPIRIVDRGSSELVYFRELAKNEAFANYPVDQLQGKQIGAEILISIDNRYVNATEIATNRQIVSIDTQKKFIGVAHNTGFRQAHLFEILSSYKQDLLPFEWVKTDKESKDALKSGIVYHPLGFEDQFVYEIYTITMVDVNGEQIPQKTVVGEFRASKILSGNLTEANIKEGGKELKKLLDNKEKLYIQFKNK